MAKAEDTQSHEKSREGNGPALPSNVLDARKRFEGRRQIGAGPLEGHARGSPGYDSFVALPRTPYQPLNEEYPEDDEDFVEIGFEEPEADGPIRSTPGEGYGVGRKWT